MGYTPTLLTLQVPMVSPEPAGCMTSPKSLIGVDLPGSKAHIETLGKDVEQERPMANHREVGGEMRERIEARARQSAMGVGPIHSSDEAVEVGERRHGGAKGLARQGARGTDR